MGHYYAEMFPNGEDKGFSRRWADYKQKCAREIDKIISKNPINFEEIKIGEKVGLYVPLRELSKVKFDDESHHVRDCFRSSFGIYGFEMGDLFWKDRFTVYDKRESDLALRVNEIPENSFDLFPVWINVKYFEPIIIHHNNT